jgi:hypothetical protein
MFMKKRATSGFAVRSKTTSLGPLSRAEAGD